MHNVAQYYKVQYYVILGVDYIFAEVMEKLHHEIEWSRPLSSDIYLSASISESKFSTDQALHILRPAKIKIYRFNKFNIEV